MKILHLKPVLLACLIACLWVGTLLAQDMPCEGTWEWVSTEYANGDVENPGSAGFREELYFGPDSDPRFVRYRDEVTVEEGLWHSACVYVPPCFVDLLSTDFGDSWVWFIWEDMGVTWIRLQTGFECPGGVGSPPTKTELFFLRGPVANQAMSWGSVKAGFR